jgi:hypothetical protein
MQWSTVWFVVMVTWWLVGFVGLILSLGLLRAARGRRHQLTPAQPLAWGLATRMVRSALDRAIVFAFIFVNAPVVYRMFDVRPNSGLGDPAMSSLPFGVIALAGLIVVAAGAASLVLLVLDLRDLLRR